MDQGVRFLDKTKKGSGKGFLKGALVLGIASLIVKLIGAFFKIPLINLIGDDGMGYFNVAYQIYTFMFIIATAGFPVAISKMVAESIARGNKKDADRVFTTAFMLLSIIGFVGAAILFLFNEQLAQLVNIPDAAPGIKAIAPAVFFISMASVIRGYFQGQQNMFPTAGSEVIEATAKMAVGLVLAYIVVNMSINPDLGSGIDLGASEVASTHERTVFASVGAIFGVTSGTILSFLLLGTIYVCVFFSMRRLKTKVGPTVAAHEKLRPRKSILKELILIAIPITIGASVSSLTTLIDMGTISRRLVINPAVFDEYGFMFREGTEFFQKSIEEGWSGTELYTQMASTLYGMYTGKALTMFNLPLTLVVALGTSVVPAISSLMAKGNKLGARGITESSIRIAVLFAAPCAIGMSVLSSGVLNLLFGDDNAKVVLSILAIAIIPVAIVSVTNSILQAYGKVYYPVINMLIGGAVKVLFNYFCIPYLGIDGAPIGTGICYTIIAVLNIIGIVRVSGMRFSWLDFLIKPIAAGCIMGVVVYLTTLFMPASRLMTIIQICIGGAVYAVSIFIVRAVKREDVLNLPKGEKIAELLTRFKLLK